MARPEQERPASGLQQVANGRASSKVDVSVRAQARVRALCVGDGALGCDCRWVVTVSCDVVAGPAEKARTRCPMHRTALSAFGWT